MSAEQPEYTPEEVQAVLEAAVAQAENYVAEEAEEAEAVEAVEENEELEEQIEAAAEEVAEEIAEAEIEAEKATEDAVAAIEKQFANEDEEEDSDSEYDDDDFDPNDETLLERIEALKNIFTPKQRDFFKNAFSNSISFTKNSTLNIGSALWYLATTSMLVGVPLAIAILNETQLTELEKEFNNAGLGPAAAAPATEEKK